jgi:hypothetical protein
MLKIRIQYTKLEEMRQALEDIKKDFEVIYLDEDHKGRNPKYANSKYKTAYVDIERKEDIYSND